MYQNPTPEKREEEKMEFLKREEIRTMEKDVKRLREREAQKERERIAAIAPEGKPKEREETLPEKPAEEEKIPLDTLIPKKLPKRPPPFTKALIRAVIVIICLLLIGFLYWFFGVRKPTEEVTPPPGETEEAGEEEEEEEERLKIVVPPALIPVEETRTSEVSKLEEIPGIFSQLMQEDLPIESFTRIAIKNLEGGRPASLEDLSSAFQIPVPEEFYKKIDPSDYTLSIFNQKQGKRMVLVGKVKDKEGLNQIFKNFEDKTEEAGPSVSGEAIPALAPYFRTTFYQGVGIRYLTISKADLGACYAQFDDYFVFTTSFEGIKKAIDRIKAGEESEELEKKVGQLFVIGFNGKTLTPALEDIIKRYRPGGVLLLGKNIESKEQLKKLIADLQSLSQKETGLPLLVMVDQEGGLISRIGFLEEKTPQSEIENEKQAYQIGEKRGKELKELGVNVNLAPLLDAANEGDFLFNRSFQKTPAQVGELAKALILGQRVGGVFTAIKHFPGYGGISFDPEENLGEPETIPEISQFKKAMEANPELIMTANVIYKSIDSSLPLTFSENGILFLKNSLNSEALIVSDDLAQNSLLKKFSLVDLVTQPLLAGVDLLIFSGWDIEVTKGLEAFLNAFRKGEIPEAKINEAISRVVQLKQELK